jgi:hypothetical protein
MFASVVVVYFVTILVSICLLLFSWFVSSFVRQLLFRRRAFLFVSVVSVVFPIVDCVGGAAGLLHSGGGFVWVLVGGMEISMYPLFG